MLDSASATSSRSIGEPRPSSKTNLHRDPATVRSVPRDAI
jgi:hypothetical protein